VTVATFDTMLTQLRGLPFEQMRGAIRMLPASVRRDVIAMLGRSLLDDDLHEVPAVLSPDEVATLLAENQ
jgi:hypothetical protein